MEAKECFQDQYKVKRTRKIKEQFFFKENVKKNDWQQLYNDYCKKNSINNTNDGDKKEQQEFFNQFLKQEDIDGFIRRNKFACRNHEGRLCKQKKGYSPLGFNLKKFDYGNSTKMSSWCIPTKLASRLKRNENIHDQLYEYSKDYKM